jgi:hypothetical protein
VFSTFCAKIPKFREFSKRIKAFSRVQFAFRGTPEEGKTTDTLPSSCAFDYVSFYRIALQIHSAKMPTFLELAGTASSFEEFRGERGG